MEDAYKQLQFVVGKIREIRIKKSMSQLELSVNSNLSQSFLASVEKGKKQPSVLTLLRIASALNVSPKVFFPEHETTSKDETKDLIINLVNSL
ncbi:MAG: helix-turn-helix domain-containing protein [Treponema sp.]|jgi:transcriptional regulator with XRE-family HTH domain|nr:helix-turn-helix domain-containing protein [Treponema sp.]